MNWMKALAWSLLVASFALNIGAEDWFVVALNAASVFFLLVEWEG